MININRDFTSQSSQKVEPLELVKCEIVKILQSLIKGEIWTIGSYFHNFMSQESRRVDS
jgi:hypothetical protein